MFSDILKLKELLNEIEEVCWDTHKQIGMKEKGGRMVPNCVRKEELETTIESNEEIVELLNFLEEQSIELDEVVYQGIAQRAFKQQFTLAENVEVHGADLVNGMLTLALEKIIPDAQKPRSIDINTPKVLGSK